MKNKILTSLLLILVTEFCRAQVLIVNNNDIRPPEHYATLLDAVNAANAGDTIYLIGSPYSYGLNWWEHVTKPLVIFGTGYNPQKDNTQISTVSQISFATGSTGSVVRGLVADNLVDWLEQSFGVEVSDCIINTGIGANDNWLIYHNIFERPYGSSGTEASNIIMWAAGNCTIRNNVFNTWGYGSFDYNTYADYGQTGNIVENNLFIGRPPGYGTWAFDQFRNATIKNNIFYGVAPDAPNGADANLNDFSRNLTYLTDHDSIPANNTQSDINFISQNPDFVDSIPLLQNQIDFTFNYHLQTTSPGHNAGTDGTDLGIYGGSDPFGDFEGYPPIPQVTLMNVSISNVESGSPVPLNVTAIANGSSNLSKAEYFFDHDLGNGNCTPVTITSGNTVTLSKQISQSLSPGTHLLGFRVRNATGTWSFPEMRVVNVCGVATVTPSGPINICKPQTVMLNAFQSGVGVSYQWKKGNTPIAGATDSTYIVTKSGTYKCTVTNACNTTTSNAVIVTVNSQPAATISTPDGLDLCGHTSLVLQANMGPGLSYQWLKGTNDIPNATNSSYSATAKATYKVVVTNSSGCTKTSQGKKVVKSCKEEIMASDQELLSVFPNPSDGEFTFSFTTADPKASVATVQIINPVGQIKFEQKFTLSDGQMIQHVSLDNANDGLYLVKVIVGDSFFQKKLIIQN